MTNKTRFRLMLIIVAVALVTLIDGHLTKAVCEIDPDTEVFGIYTATLDGNNMEPLITDSYREMTHARVSPDGNWITFSRYNNIGEDGYATEKDLYFNTEVVVMKTDGSVIKTVAGPAVNEVAVNSYWYGNDSLLYLGWPKGTPPKKVEIIGYNGDAMEPFISPDDQYLFFNTPNQKGNPDIHFARRINDDAFQYIGKLPGVNEEAVWDGVPSLDLHGNFYFTSTRIHGGMNPEIGILPILYRGSFDGNSVSDVGLVEGDIEYGQRGWINADSASTDGSTLYLNQVFIGENYSNMIPTASKFRLAKKSGDGFNIDYSLDYIFDNINGDDTEIEYAPAISYDGLEFFFTKLKFNPYDAKIYRSIRRNINEPFGEPHIISAIADEGQSDFVEAPSISRDGKTLYYHKLNTLTDTFEIYKVTRNKNHATFTDPDSAETGGIYKLYLNESMDVINEERLNVPKEIRPADPHQVGDKVVFPGTTSVSTYNSYGCNLPEIEGNIKGIWIMNEDGTGLHPLAIPRDSEGNIVLNKGVGVGNAGDNDPKLSPDGTKVAFMRRTLSELGQEGVHNWHTYVMDVNMPFSEVDISAQHLTDPWAIAKADGLPEWIDNERLLVWYVDSINERQEVHTMKYDGSERKKVPLPDGYDYKMPSIFPQEGLGENAGIIFCTRLKESSNPYEIINIIGETSIGGAYDLALEYENSTVGWMVYTGIVFPGLLHTHLAKTIDNGKTWTFVKRINESTQDAVISRGQIYKGTWVNEVPTLVYVPDDPGREWKLYWHKYFSAEVNPNNPHERIRILTHSWIMYKYADTPEDLDVAEEIKLFSTHSAVTPARFNFEQYFDNSNELVSSYSELGSLYKDGVLYLAFSRYAMPVDEEFGTLILVSSSDHGQTWNYIDKVLDSSDAQDFGYDMLTAASLAEEEGRIFLLITPFLEEEQQHCGTYIFEFRDISRAELRRDIQDKLIIHKFLPTSIPPEFMRNAGQSDYDKYNTYGGIIIPQMDIRLFPTFANLYNTKEKIVEESFSPVSVIQSEPKKGHAPLTVSFNGSQSTSPHGDIVSYEWDFGDGSTSTGMKTSHIFTSAGEYTVTLTITDDLGLKGKSQTHIIVFEKGFRELPAGCYNNVFNPAKGEKALIVVELTKQGHVRLNLYNTRGDRIRELADEEKEAGIYKYYWDGKSDSGDAVGSGLYFVHIQAGDYRKTKKIVVVK